MSAPAITLSMKELTERFAAANKRAEKANERLIRAQTRFEALQQEEKRLSEEAKAKFGTDNLDAIREKVRAEKEAQVADLLQFERELGEIEIMLSAAETGLESMA